MKGKSILIMSSLRWFNASAHYALFLAESLKRSGFDVVIFGSPGSPFIIKAKEHGFSLVDNIDLLNTGFLKYLRSIFQYRKLFKERNFDIINPHISRDQAFAFLSLLGLKKNIIRTRTDSIPPKRNIFNKIYYKISSMHYIVSSEYMVPYITRMGIPGTRVSVVPLEMNYKAFTDYKSKRNLKSELEIPEKKIVVSFIGRLDKIKGVEYFINSYTKLRDKDKFHYLISGEEINLSIKELKEIANNLKVAQISFINRADDVRDILSVTDIGVIPSIGSESICRIGLEMISFGIPIIGSNINSIPELISSFGGIVVNPGSPEEIATALDYLAVEENYKRMKEAIKLKIANRSPDKFSTEYMEIFSKALG